MLRAASLAPRLLGDSTPRVAEFLRGQWNPDGGFRGRGTASDLYYSVFGLEGLRAVGADVPHDAIGRYLATFGGGEGLDFVHLACLARCWASLPGQGPTPDARRAILQRIEACRAADGGYAQTPGAGHGTAYGCFLALGAHQDLEADLPDPAGVLHCLAALRTADGAWANEHQLPAASTPATAAAVAVARHLDPRAGPAGADWLLARVHPLGGFLATPSAPIPDLLSTATALHALAGMNVPLEPIREPCLDFIDSLWTGQGAFRGNALDATPDCEYTYYGLLALGHLSG